ncbi:hypothetical protein QTP70_000917 [Hemibagrus guttatus]|uniref:Reverse transcriptase domain-containing protein n=1 Tax=Hemibagrus guttatus TaxID=175788 RepID=A0AAE0PV09_9TELE|nr:hypothetical protein QTP70_000917 [Hemibagrus guttatus]
MTAHQLKLNPSKTELLIIPGDPSPAQDLAISLNNSMISPSATAHNLGVTMDNQLSFSSHVTNVTRSCRFLLYNIRRIRPFLSTQATQVLVQSLVISRLDYCSSLLAGLPLNAIRPLQMIQNAATRLVFNLPKFSHTTPLLRSLHWLPVAARIRFKTLMLAYKDKNGPAPSYLKALVTPRTAPGSLRSTSTARLVSPSLRVRKHLGPSVEHGQDEGREMVFPQPPQEVEALLELVLSDQVKFSARCTPRNLVLLTISTGDPSMYSGEWSLCALLKSTTISLVLSTFRDRLLALHQAVSRCTSSLYADVVFADETHHGRVIRELDDVVRAVHCCTVVSQQSASRQRPSSLCLKKSTISCLNDYHPVALPPTMKCFERLVMRHIKTQLPPSLDPLQFAYRPNCSTDDAITTTLHLSLTHLDNKDSYVQMLFIDFSSAFNTIISQHLTEKLSLRGLNTSLCNWILDFLTGRSQSVQIGNSLSSTTHSGPADFRGLTRNRVLFTSAMDRQITWSLGGRMVFLAS